MVVILDFIRKRGYPQGVPGNWGLLTNTQPISVLDGWITTVSENQ